MNRTFLVLAALPLIPLLSGCGGDSPTQATDMPTASPTPATIQVTVPVVVVFNNAVLNEPCEALTGDYARLHKGAFVTLEDESSHEVGRARLGEPSKKPPPSLCAWGATIHADVLPEHSYTVNAGGRWTSDELSSIGLENGETVTITTN